MLDYLSSVGHNLTSIGSGGVVCGVHNDKRDGRIYANADYRKQGGTDGF